MDIQYLGFMIIESNIAAKTHGHTFVAWFKHGITSGNGCGVAFTQNQQLFRLLIQIKLFSVTTSDLAETDEFSTLVSTPTDYPNEGDTSGMKNFAAIFHRGTAS